MAVESSGGDLIQAVALLGAGVVAVPIFRHLGLGSVLGYLAGGIVVGPHGLGLFTDPQAILHIAELGVVMFLFVIGLEMEPARLWGLRHKIFGLGMAQVATCAALLTGVGIAGGLSPVIAFIAASGFVMTSTAVVMQILDERGDTSTPAGQRFVSILLFEDLAIVPLLAVVAVLSAAVPASGNPRWMSIAIAAGSVAALILAGRFLLNPLFRILAKVGAREVMTAAALLVVLGAALTMQLGGLSMALGAFLAGVLLSESSFRHQLETEIEPFRGLLLGLFFLGVGMALDLPLIAESWQLILAGVFAYMVVKAIGIYVVARIFRACHEESVYRAALMAQGGEFAFVLYSAAASAGIIDGRAHASLTAMVILSMALTPLLVLGLKYLVRPDAKRSMEGIDEADGLTGSVLIIGFGRIGQVMSQLLLARGIEVSIIDTDTDMIRSAEEFGFKVYYGDGTRLDVLRMSGAGQAKAIVVAVGSQTATDKIIELAKTEFPLAKLIVRSFDREHALKLIEAGIDLQVRETFESAMALGEIALGALGVPKEEAAEIAADIRRRDAERFKLEIAGGGLKAGRGLLLGNKMRPTPLVPPRRPAPAATAAAAPDAQPADAASTDRAEAAAS